MTSLQPENTMQERNQQRLTKINERNRLATLPQIAAYFNAGSSKSATVQTIQRKIINIVFRSRRPTRVPLLSERYKVLPLALALQHCHWTVDYWKHVV
ncbi:HTH_Tnp_Tc3_2 domain-containing protein [Trichonephila clavipes]|nr:HTH_Tnp_Tc3_2 domain-containing protein [Trichonephila clavipes]